MPHPLLLSASLAVLTLAACAHAPINSGQEETMLSSAQPAAAVQAVKTTARAAIGAFGLDLSAADPAVRPGDDFYHHANGRWLSTAEIPADRSRWGTFDQLDTQAEERVRALIEALPAKADPGSVHQKVGDYYRSYLDTAAIERAGLEPARPGLKAIAAARTHAEIAALMGRPDMPGRSPLGVGISTDEKNPDRYIVGIAQSGLGLPDREYYLKDDATFAQLRDKYLAHIERMLTLAEQQNPAAQAKAILALETKMAQAHWPIEQRRERELTYNLRSRAELDQLAPKFPWAALLNSSGLNERPEFILAELSAIEALAREFTTVSVATWRSYLTYHYLVGAAELLPKAFDDEAFEFYGRTLNGQPQQRERWKRAVRSVGGAVGEAVGQLYVAKYFPPESKAKMNQLVKNLRKAYGQRIAQLPWMTPATKTVALEKLEAFRPKIGYPDKWRDYSTLEVRAGDAFGNALRAALFEWQRQLKRIDEPTDREEWGMNPHTVNAYYNSTFNEIVFPAAILQPPFFDPNADDAVNYGAIGGVIGHEMGHGFDDQGAKSDAKGVLRTWWQPEDETAFKNLTAGLIKQYEAYEPLPGLKLNGQLTLGENIGDLGGLSVAYEAYKLSLRESGADAPVLDGLTGEQRFFLSWAQVWRLKMREARLRNQIMSDPHSPAEFRVNGVVRNMDAWYQAFDVAPTDKLYLPPKLRVRIW